MTHMNGGDSSLDRIESLGVFADWKMPSDVDIDFVAHTLREAHGGFGTIVLGFWPKKADKDGWVPPCSWKEARDKLVACLDVGLNPVVMVWAVRSKKAIEQACKWAREVQRGLGWILLDCESDWHRGHDIDPDQAAFIVDKELGGYGYIWGVTGLGRLHKTVAPLASQASFVVPQCYSFWKSGSANHWSHSRSTFPGPQQASGFRRWSEAAPNAEVIMGLGCYWGARPAQGLTPALTATHTMRIATIETAALGVRSIWWWSLKWLMKKDRRGEEVRRFFGVMQ